MFTIPSQTRTFIEEGFRNEAEIEQVFLEHYQVLMGVNVVLLPKSGIQTAGGSGTIPDAYAFDLDNNTWYLIEVELLHHGVWQHIVRQISMQLTAARDSRSQEKILDKAVDLYERDERFRGIVQEKEIKEIHLRKRLGDILKKEPLIGLPIDKTNSDLDTWAKSLRTGVKIWEIKKFVDLKNPQIKAYYLPDAKAVINTVDAEQDETVTPDGLTKDDVTVEMLIKAGLLRTGEILWFDYTTRHNNKKHKIEARITEGGNLVVDGQEFTSLSSSALFGISQTGSTRPSANGWKSWKSERGKLLRDIRAEFLGIANG